VSANNPTWNDDIKEMFTPADIACMKNQGVDLTSYDTVSGMAQQILAQVVGQNDASQAPNAQNNPPSMPPHDTTDTPYWTLDMINTFNTWIQQGMPET
jgi:hypothetical protein